MTKTERDALVRAAEMLDAYYNLIVEKVPAAEMERWHYAPEALDLAKQLQEIAAPPALPARVEWYVDWTADNRIRINIGNQRFQIEYYPMADADEGVTAEQRRDWYVKQLTTALSKLAGSTPPALPDRWQPIETLPDDAYAFLFGHRFHGDHEDEFTTFFVGGRLRGSDRKDLCEDQRGGCLYRATHWQPLRAPIEETGPRMNPGTGFWEGAEIDDDAAAPEPPR